MKDHDDHVDTLPKHLRAELAAAERKSIRYAFQQLADAWHTLWLTILDALGIPPRFR